MPMKTPQQRKDWLSMRNYIILLGMIHIGLSDSKRSAELRHRSDLLEAEIKGINYALKFRYGN